MASHDQLIADEGLYDNLYMNRFKFKGPGGTVDTAGLVST